MEPRAGPGTTVEFRGPAHDDQRGVLDRVLGGVLGEPSGSGRPEQAGQGLADHQTQYLTISSPDRRGALGSFGHAHLFGRRCVKTRVEGTITSRSVRSSP